MEDVDLDERERWRMGEWVSVGEGEGEELLRGGVVLVGVFEWPLRLSLSFSEEVLDRSLGGRGLLLLPFGLRFSDPIVGDGGGLVSVAYGDPGMGTKG